jgi:NADPH:quinone reductase-like Zn-dependent oxidoreductase
MKAAVLHQFGAIPQYDEFPDPVPAGPDQLVIHLKAVAIKNLDKLRTTGTHYASHKKVPAVVGIDGVGVLDDGKRVYALGITGMAAEKSLVTAGRYTPLPAGLSDELAAALPNAAMGSVIALLYRGQMKKGEVVFINGATGVTGQIAVQLARYYGASRIIATGRNAESLHHLLTLGADEVISLKEDEESIIKRIKQIHGTTPIDVVVDYLWGRPVELILEALKSGGIGVFTHRVRIVTVGSMAGDAVNVSANILRSSATELLGSGLGSVSEESFRQFNTVDLPKLFELAAEGKLSLGTVVADLKDIASVWHKDVGSGKRLVIKI